MVVEYIKPSDAVCVGRAITKCIDCEHCYIPRAVERPGECAEGGHTLTKVAIHYGPPSYLCPFRRAGARGEK